MAWLGCLLAGACGYDGVDRMLDRPLSANYVDLDGPGALMELDDGEIVVVDAEGSMTSEASLGQHVLLARGHDGIYGIPNSLFDGGPGCAPPTGG